MPTRRHPRNNLNIRERYAEDRTVLANERTLLSYMRTSLTIIAVGFTLNKFFELSLIQLLGIFLILVGIGIMIFGIWRFINMKNLIISENNQQ